MTGMSMCAFLRFTADVKIEDAVEGMAMASAAKMIAAAVYALRSFAGKLTIVLSGSTGYTMPVKYAPSMQR